MLYKRIHKELEQLREHQAMRRLTILHHTGIYVERGGHRLINLASNDYLALGSKQHLLEEFFDEVGSAGLLLGSGSSRLLTGHYPVVEELEDSLTHLFGREAALVFNSGYHMNMGILPALTNHRTLILADKLIHASIIDGIKLSGAAFDRFRHNDLFSLEQILVRKASEYENVIVVVESLYSMDGDVADLVGLVALKKRFPQLLLYVDEAHAIGVRGESGLGLAQETGTVEDIDFLCGTFGKAIGGMGGYLVCNREVKDYLINRSRPLIYSTALPPLVYAWVLFVIRRLGHWSRERKQLHDISTELRAQIEALGFPMPSTSQIIPLIIGTNEAAVRLSEAFVQAGYYAPAVRPPTVPEGSSRLRLSLTAGVVIEGLEAVIRGIIH